MPNIDMKTDSGKALQQALDSDFDRVTYEISNDFTAAAHARRISNTYFDEALILEAAGR